jgi:hypothetical protein
MSRGYIGTAAQSSHRECSFNNLPSNKNCACSLTKFISGTSCGLWNLKWPLTSTVQSVPSPHRCGFRGAIVDVDKGDYWTSMNICRGIYRLGRRSNFLSSVPNQVKATPIVLSCWPKEPWQWRSLPSESLISFSKCFLQLKN